MKRKIFIFIIIYLISLVPLYSRDSGKSVFNNDDETLIVSGDQSGNDTDKLSDTNRDDRYQKEPTISPVGHEPASVFTYGWLPGTRLFNTMLADPRKTVFSGSIRFNEHAFDRYRKNTSSLGTGIVGDDRIFGFVSIGGRLPFYRWRLPEGSLQTGIEGSVWALFSFKSRNATSEKDISTMINADYMLAVATEYSWKALAVQFRFYHLSSHVGDEFLKLYPDLNRINVSYEAIDLFLSYQVILQIRIYAGIGCLVHNFHTYKFDPVYIEYGVELRPFKKRWMTRQMTWQPFIAAHLRNWQNNSWSLDGNFMIGIEFLPKKKLQNTCIQLFVSYYHGNTVEGQFYHLSSSFFAIGLSFEL